MTTRTRPSVRLSDTGELLAAIPHLLAFTPSESLVVIALGGESPAGIGVTLRTDLPPPGLALDLARQLIVPLRSNDTVAVCVLLITAAGASHRGLVATLQREFAAAGITTAHAAWAGSITAGVPWQCYDDPGCHGTVADPGSSVLAATSAALGLITYGSRDDLVEQLAPDDAAALARRSALLDGLVARPPSTADSVILLRAAVRDARSGVLPVADEHIAALAIALCDHHARDACLGYTDTDDIEAAERLWAALTRQAPEPERSEAAALLAFFAYLRGNGALAGIALDVAEEALPGHRLAWLLRMVLEHGVPPERLQEIAGIAAAAAENLGAGEHAGEHTGDPAGEP